MKQVKQPAPKPNVSDQYKGLKKATVSMVLTDKNGKKTIVDVKNSN